MSKSRTLRSIGLGMAIALISACSSMAPVAEVAAPTIQAEKPVNYAAEQWKPSHENGVRLLTAGGMIDMKCIEGRCAALIAPKSDCKPGAKYPIMANTDDKLGVIPGQCVPYKGTNYVLLQDATAFAESLVTGQTFWIAYPADAGNIDLLVIEPKNFKALSGYKSQAGGQINKDKKPGDRDA